MREVDLKPFDLGGLGIRSIRLRSKLLLAKWLWRFFTEV